MRDFELLRMPRRRSEVDEQTRTSTIYCGTETGNFKGGGPAGRDRERGVPAPCIGGIGVLSLAGGGPGRLGCGAQARTAAYAALGRPGGTPQGGNRTHARGDRRDHGGELGAEKKDLKLDDLYR